MSAAAEVESHVLGAGGGDAAQRARLQAAPCPARAAAPQPPLVPLALVVSLRHNPPCHSGRLQMPEQCSDADVTLVMGSQADATKIEHWNFQNMLNPRTSLQRVGRLDRASFRDAEGKRGCEISVALRV